MAAQAPPKEANEETKETATGTSVAGFFQSDDRTALPNDTKTTERAGAVQIEAQPAPFVATVPGNNRTAGGAKKMVGEIAQPAARSMLGVQDSPGTEEAKLNMTAVDVALSPLASDTSTLKKMKLSCFTVDCQKRPGDCYHKGCHTCSIGKVTKVDKTTIGELVSGKEATTKAFTIVALVNTNHESYSVTIQAILDKAKHANADYYFLVVSCFGKGESLRKVWSKLWSANNKNKSRLKYDTLRRRIHWKYTDAVPPLLSKYWESGGKELPVSFFRLDRHSNVLKVCDALP